MVVRLSRVVGLIPARAGKTVCNSPGVLLALGSSPRGRGKRGTSPSIRGTGRLIPARAGKTRAIRHAHGLIAAHPRAGGENPGKTDVLTSADGSSPRGRGKPDVIATTSVGVRLIPARAGKTVGVGVDHVGVQAHPRAGGENLPISQDRMTPSGSSPRGRGKREEPARRRNRRWLIPARAGKTASSCRARVDRAAHPRAGGENAEHRADPVDESGSSPRGRGKRGAVVVSQSRNAAHPRAGGENLINAGVEVLNAGSSPRGRGKRKSRRCGRRRRLIPARAGKTGSRAFRRRPSTAHPRAGGENGRSIHQLHDVEGSSPRGRGKLAGVGTRIEQRRLIPARVGKTRGPGGYQL